MGHLKERQSFLLFYLFWGCKVQKIPVTLIFWQSPWSKLWQGCWALSYLICPDCRMLNIKGRVLCISQYNLGIMLSIDITPKVNCGVSQGSNWAHLKDLKKCHSSFNNNHTEMCNTEKFVIFHEEIDAVFTLLKSLKHDQILWYLNFQWIFLIPSHIRREIIKISIDNLINYLTDADEKYSRQACEYILN